MVAQLQIGQDVLDTFCRKWKVRELSLFGSALRNDFTADSDLDFLVTFQQDASWNLWDWVEMQNELSVLTGRKVDIVSQNALRNPFRREHIMNNRMVLYAA